MSGIKYRLAKSAKWMQDDHSLEDALRDTPSSKVSTTSSFLQHIRYRLEHLAAALGHCGDLRHRKLRWRSFIKRQQAYTAVCKEICNGDSQTVVAYGDASFSSSCCKGTPSTPTVSLRRKLSQCCHVRDTDEFRTSMLCCACKSRMDGMPLPVAGDASLYKHCGQAACKTHKLLARCCFALQASIP